MDFINASILSVIEGFSEFLPISSTGHLILASDILRISQTDFVKSFEIIIQLGAILGVFLLYYKKFFNLKLWPSLAAALIPSVLIGLFFYHFIKEFLIGNSFITVLALFLGGVALIIIELLHKEKKENIDNLEEIGITKGFIIGLFQSISIVPGVSRAAATIVGGLLLGTKRKVATEFSFLLAVPTMLGASLLDLYKENFHFNHNEISLILVGFIGSFLVAIISVKFLLSFIKTHTFIPFGIYRIVLAILFWFFILR